jgi:cadmium resistance protein CadD (predicted permease)
MISTGVLLSVFFADAHLPTRSVVIGQFVGIGALVAVGVHKLWLLLRGRADEGDDALIFAVMTAIWCAAGYKLVNNRIAARHLRANGRLALPGVLIALGLYVLSDALALLY